MTNASEPDLDDFIHRYEIAFGERLSPAKAKAHKADLDDLYRCLRQGALPTVPHRASQQRSSAEFDVIPTTG